MTMTNGTTNGSTTTTTTTAQQPQGGSDANSNGFDVTRAFFGNEIPQKNDKSTKGGDGAPPQGTEGGGEHGTEHGGENAGNHEPDRGAEDDPADGTGTGNDGNADHAETVDTEVWQFEGKDYTTQEVSEALKQHGMYSRFNQTITPLIDSVKRYEDTARRLEAMAQTETAKEIDELTRALSSGKLDARQYQQAHQQLTRAQQRAEILTTAAEQEAAERAKTLKEARNHNARLVGMSLIKSGWSMEKINRVQAVAQEFMTADQFADALSPGLMEALNDALELRAMRNKTAAELSAKGKKAVKVNGTTTNTAPVKAKKSEMGSSDWLSKNFFGGKN